MTDVQICVISTTEKKPALNRGSGKPAIMFKIFLDFLIAEARKTKETEARVLVINCHIRIFELAAEQLTTWEIRKYEENFKTSWNYYPVLSPPPGMKGFSVLVKIF